LSTATGAATTNWAPAASSTAVQPVVPVAPASSGAWQSYAPR
jgi:hypothetical protein